MVSTQLNHTPGPINYETFPQREILTELRSYIPVLPFFDKIEFMFLSFL